MEDIFFNTEIRDIIIDKANDFELTENPSTQNGAIILEGLAFNVVSPIYGVGITNILGGDRRNAAKQMNRWKQQVGNDGGSANWTSTPDNGVDFNFISTVQYPL